MFYVLLSSVHLCLRAKWWWGAKPRLWSSEETGTLPHPPHIHLQRWSVSWVPSHFIYKEPRVKVPLPWVCQASPQPEIWVEAEGVTRQLWLPGWVFCWLPTSFHVSVTQQWLQRTNSFKLKHTPTAGQVLMMFMFFKKWGVFVCILF